MTTINTNAEFVASLNEAQRDYFLGRLAEIQHQLQETMRQVSRGLSAISAFNQDALTVLALDTAPPRRVLFAGNTEYHYLTVPGSGRIKVSFRDGIAISMWESGRKDPWIQPLEGFKSFLKTGHAKELHCKLLEVDRRRRSR